jgi:hypothetical protein
LQKDIIYFCREYNDLDHVVPIADELLNNSDIKSFHFVNYNFNKSFNNDFRIIYLKRHSHFNYFDLSEIINLKENYFLKFFDILEKIHHYFSRFKTSYTKHVLKVFDFNTIVERKNNTVFLFDHSNSSFIENAYNYSSTNNIPISLLMHGLNPIENLLMSTKMHKAYESNKNWEHYNKADAFYVNNEHYMKQSISHGVTNEIIRTVGSARFSYKWSNILDNITPTVDLPASTSNCVKIVIMLNKYRYNTWQEEIERVIKSLLLIDNVFVIVKPHTRNMEFEKLNNNNKIFIADQDCHSRKLFEWSDLTLFTISSIFLDALLLDKPVLFLRLATSNKLSCNHIMKNWNIDCRDDLIMWVNRFKKDRKTRTYTEKERTECLNYYVNDHDNQLLSRYSKSILELKKRGQ